MAGFRADAASADPTRAADVERLRRSQPLPVVHAALKLAEARRRGQSKFGERAAGLFADPIGLEMASSLRAGSHKSARFASAFPGGAVLDLCCGIGGDSMALALAGLRVLCVDHDPVRAWMAGTNAACESIAADAMDPSLPDGPFHLDPSRRTPDNARRHFRLEDLEPGPEVIGAIIQRRKHGAIKLGPGVDRGTLSWPGELEILSEGGRLTQAVLWTGSLAGSGSRRRATLLPSGDALWSDGPVREAPVGLMGRWVFEPDDSVERAGLFPELCESVGAPLLHRRLGLLTSDVPITSPWLRGFEVVAEMGWHQDRVLAWLRANDAGIVEVKTRGKATNPDEAQARLSGRGGRPYTVFVLRFDKAIRAIVTVRSG